MRSLLRGIVLTALSCLWGCPAAHPAHPSPATSTIRDAGAAIATSDPLALPPDLESLREVACTFTEELWFMESVESPSNDHHYLRFFAGGPAFAEVFGGTNVKLELPVALASAGGRLTLYSNGLSIHGHLEAAEMRLYPAVPFAMSGVFIPNDQRRLVWRSAKPGVITVGTEPIPRIRPIREELTAERSCEDISMDKVFFKDSQIDKAIGARAKQPPERPPWPWMRSGPVNLYSTPDGDAVVQIEVVEPRDDRLLIHPPRVLAVAKGHTRIALETFGGVLFGWIRSEQLVMSKAQYMDLSHDAFSMVKWAKGAGGSYVACKREIPLVAEAGRERRLVGTVRAGVAIERVRSLGGWAEIVIRDSGVIATEGASLLSRESDLVDCRPTK